jgi:hypothetical protein
MSKGARTRRRPRLYFKLRAAYTSRADGSVSGRRRACFRSLANKRCGAAKRCANPVEGSLVRKNDLERNA